MTQLCVVTQDIKIKEMLPGEFGFFEANSLSLPIYFALKHKHGYTLVNHEDLIEYLQIEIQRLSLDFDYVVIPESRSLFLQTICKNTNNSIILNKNSKQTICESFLNSKKWSRDEIKSAQSQWSEMGDAFEINKIKSNKRAFYEPFLFEKKEIAGKVLLLDDFKRSGSTMRAMQCAISEFQTISSCAVFFEFN